MSGILVRLVLALALAIVAIGVAHKTQHGDLAEIVAIERLTLAGQPVISGGALLSNLYNRILFPFVFVQATHLLPGFDARHLFVALRFAAFALCFLLLFSSIDSRARQAGVDATSAALIVAVAFIASLIRHPEPQGSDIFDLTLMFYAFLFVIEGRPGPAFLVACLTAINRESGAFTGVAYFLLRAGHERVVRLLATSALLVVVPYALAIAVRTAIYKGSLPSGTFGQWLTGLPLNLSTMATDLLRLNPANDLFLLLAMLALPALLLAMRPASPGYKVRVAMACAAIFVITLLFGLAREIRVFLPCVSLLVAASVAGLPAPARSRALVQR